MMDEFDELKSAFDAASPTPDPAKRAKNLRLAEENFAALQGSADEVRPISERGPTARIGKGIMTMLNALTTRGGMTATTALVAVGVIAILPMDAVRMPSSGLEVDLENVEPAPETGVEVGTIENDPTFLPTPSIAPSDVEIRNRVGEIALEESTSNLSLDDELRADTAAPTGTEPRLAPQEESPVLGKLAEMEVAPLERHAEDMAGVAAAPQSKAVVQNYSGEAVVAPVQRDQVFQPEGDTEAYANAPENPLSITTEAPVSTFSIDVDTAAYAVARRWLTGGQMPPAEAIRVEELINYFPYDYAAPDGSHPFKPTISVVPTPWNTGTNLVHIGIQGTLPAVDERPPLNLVFLIDTSGSMQQADKLPLLKQSFRMMLNELRPEDEVSIVTYAGSAGQVLEPTRAAQRSTILAALDRLEAGGSTAGQAGLQQAYQVAEGMGGEDEVTRVILATDGDFNVGLSDPEALETFIADKRDTGTYLSVLGFGRGNLDDATMQALAQNGNGQAAYIDTLSEARKVLVDQLTGALFPIANDVKIQVEFNPAEIAEYRLIGYETRALNREDFANDKVDAGDIGAGHRVTAIYEVTPVGSDAIRNGPLRYSETEAQPAQASDELGYFKLRYKNPGEATSILIEEPIFEGSGRVSMDTNFSIAMAGFAQLLRDSNYVSGWDWNDAIAMATQARGEDPFGYRSEAISLMRLAESLSR